MLMLWMWVGEHAEWNAMYFDLGGVGRRGG